MLSNFVWETTTTTGTGTLTLSAKTGYPRFSDAFPDKSLVSYTILDSNSLPLEFGIGTYTASNTLARTKVLGTYVSGTLNVSNPTAVSLSAGTYNIICSASMGASMPSLSGADTANGSSGAFMPYPHMMSGSAGTLVVTADRLYLMPFTPNTTRQIASVKFRVSTGGSGNMRMGIYKCDTSGAPGALLYSSGDIAVAASGVHTWTLTNPILLPPDWYYLGWATKGTTPTINTSGITAVYAGNTPCNTDSTVVQAVSHKIQALGGGWTALPDPPSSLSGALAAYPAFSMAMA